MIAYVICCSIFLIWPTYDFQLKFHQWSYYDWIIKKEIIALWTICRDGFKMRALEIISLQDISDGKTLRKVDVTSKCKAIWSCCQCAFSKGREHETTVERVKHTSSYHCLKYSMKALNVTVEPNRKVSLNIETYSNVTSDAICRKPNETLTCWAFYSSVVYNLLIPITLLKEKAIAFLRSLCFFDIFSLQQRNSWSEIDYVCSFLTGSVSFIRN